MSTVRELPNNKRTREESSLWIAKIDRGLTDSESKEFSEWLLSNSENKDVFMDMAHLWDDLDGLSRLAEIFPREQVSEEPGREEKEIRPPAFVWRTTVALAGVILFVNLAVLAVGLIGSSTSTDFEGFYVTAIGDQSTLNLPDGSKLLLNTNSRVTVTFNDEHRLLNLEKGELHIDVAHDKARPLSVLAGGRIVQAVGTAFNVQMLSEAEIELTVTDGKVRVQTHEADEQPKIKRLSSASQVVLKGEVALLSREQNRVSKVNETIIDENLSWRKGNLVFRGETLEDAVSEISRYTAVDFKIMDEDIKELRIAGRFKASDVNSMLFALQENFGITSQQQGNLILLARN